MNSESDYYIETGGIEVSTGLPYARRKTLRISDTVDRSHSAIASLQGTETERKEQTLSSCGK
jgi:hypothetical protein